jgi:hypothetical protein
MFQTATAATHVVGALAPERLTERSSPGEKV